MNYVEPSLKDEGAHSYKYVREFETKRDRIIQWRKWVNISGKSCTWEDVLADNLGIRSTIQTSIRENVDIIMAVVVCNC